MLSTAVTLIDSSSGVADEVLDEQPSRILTCVTVCSRQGLKVGSQLALEGFKQINSMQNVRRESPSPRSYGRQVGWKHMQKSPSMVARSPKSMASRLHPRYARIRDQPPVEACA
jgi:hypothetical protein